MFKKFLYYMVGFVGLFMNNYAAANNLPIAKQLQKEADKEGLFTFFTNFFSSGAELVFFVIGGITFIVWVWMIISDLWQWKSDRKDLGEVLRNIIIVSCIVAFVFIILVWANALLG